MTLVDLRPGEEARVTGCRGNGPVFQRLAEMGLIQGALLRVVRYAPFGDPMHVALVDYHLALRKAEARMIEIERLPGGKIGSGPRPHRADSDS